MVQNLHQQHHGDQNHSTVSPNHNIDASSSVTTIDGSSPQQQQQQHQHHQLLQRSQLGVAKMYLESLQRQPIANISGMFHFMQDREHKIINTTSLNHNNNKNNDSFINAGNDDEEKVQKLNGNNIKNTISREDNSMKSSSSFFSNQQQQQQLSSLSQSSSVKLAYSINVTSEAGQTIFRAFQKCEGLKPQPSSSLSSVRRSPKQLSPPEQQQQEQKQEQPPSSSSSLTTTLRTPTQQQQQQQQQNEVVTMQKRLQEQEKRNKYMDCLSYMTCPQAFVQYSKCWQKMMNEIKYQEQQHYNYQTQSSLDPMINSSTVPTKEALTKSIQNWTNWKEEGHLNSICFIEREEIERCVGATIIQANYDEDTVKLQ
jgi:hypothetical protein